MRQIDEELGQDVRRELDALDRALAGEPVDAEFDAVARLARDMRAARPKPAEEFAARLDARAGEGFAPEPGAPASGFALRVREWLAGARPMRVLAPAGAVATVLVVASVAVIQSGGGGDATSPTTSATTATQGQPKSGAAGAEPALPESGGAGGTAAPLEAQSLDAAAEGDDRVAPNSGREIEHSATLALSADGDEFEDVSDGVVSVTDRYDGIVLSSREDTSGDSSHATFELKVPSQDLPAALADLSDLAHVESRSEDALDITAPTVTARQRLTDARTEVEGLLKQLADADSPKESKDVGARLDIARAEAAQAKAEFQNLARRAKFADVRVTVSSDGGGDGSWGVDDAVDDIGDALSTVGGVALISAAIFLPFALIAALIGFAWRRSVRRGRERALGD